MSVAALNVVQDDDNNLWIEAKPFTDVLAQVRDALAEATPQQQIEQFGSIDNWLSMFLENLAEALDGANSEVSDNQVAEPNEQG